MLPSDVHLESGEQVLFITRRHIINYLPILIGAVVALAGLGFASGWLSANGGKLAGLPVAGINSIVIVLMGLAVLVALVGFLVYRRSLLVLTNIHLIVVTQAGLFGRSISKLTLDELQDAEGVRRGVFASIFDYGTIEIETAGADENFRFYYAPQPLEVANRIVDQHEVFEREHTFERP